MPADFGLRWLRFQCLCFASQGILLVGFVTESPQAEPRPCRSCPETSQPKKPAGDRLRSPLHGTGPAGAVISHQCSKTSQPSAARSQNSSSGFVIRDLIYAKASPQASDLRCSKTLHEGPCTARHWPKALASALWIFPNQLQVLMD